MCIGYEMADYIANKACSAEFAINISYLFFFTLTVLPLKILFGEVVIKYVFVCVYLTAKIFGWAEDIVLFTTHIKGILI